jgi:hypothetical protein
MDETPNLDAAIDEIYVRLDEVGGDPMNLPEEMRPIALLYTFQAMVDNGGFRYPMEADFPFTPPYSIFVDAYRAVGAESAAALLEDSLARFPMSNPHLDTEARNAFLDSLNEENQFFQNGDKVCGDEAVWQQMEAYVTQRPSVFGLIE